MLALLVWTVKSQPDAVRVVSESSSSSKLQVLSWNCEVGFVLFVSQNLFLWIHKLQSFMFIKCSDISLEKAETLKNLFVNFDFRIFMWNC